MSRGGGHYSSVGVLLINSILCKSSILFSENLRSFVFQGRNNDLQAPIQWERSDPL